jgi:UPF0755 protein
MDGFKRPQRPQGVRPPADGATSLRSEHDLPPIDDAVLTSIDASSVDGGGKKPKNALVLFFRSKRVIVGSGLVALLLLVVMSLWYHSQLRPVDTTSTNEIDVSINPDTSFSYVIQSLKKKGLIRSELAAKFYGYSNGKSGALKEGTCRLKPSQSTQAIIAQLTTGCNDFKSITFYPGATIEQPLYKPEHAVLDQTLNIKNVLAKAGYSDSEISTALSTSYDGPLFADKPAGSSLEGYVYGETYHVDPNASAETVLKTTFAEMYKAVQKYDLVNKYKAKGLDLFQGITLASIVQRELNCEGKPTEERIERCYQYQRTIAQIFLKRLKENIALGSDVTFIYAADQMKVTPRVDLDSPYNTRKNPGLPPGPIASPGIHALRAVADPTDTDYLFFIAGDDGLIYFAKTDAEHQQNIKKHCQQLCNEL